jgi:hypothetical protein
MKIGALLASAILILANSAVLAAPAGPSPRDIRASFDTRESQRLYQDTKTGLAFSYPQSWHSEQDKDALAVFRGTTSDNGFAEVKLSLHEGMKNADSTARILLAVLGQLPEFKTVSSERIRFGSRLQYTALEELVSFKAGENVVYERLVFFPCGSNIVSLTLVSQASKYRQALPTFDRILASVHAFRPTGTAANTRGEGGQKLWKFVPYSAKNGKISLMVPEGWQEHNNDPGKELDMKFTGKNADGTAGEIFISGAQRPPDMQLAQFESVYEEKYLQPFKDFRKLSTRNASVGLSRNDGIIQECIFTADGHSGKQWAVFFADSENFYCVALNTMYWKDADSKELFERVLSSIRTSH